MHLALVFGEGETVRVPAQGPLASLGIDRNPEIINQIRARDALGLVLGKLRVPGTRQIHLGESRGADECGGQQQPAKGSRAT